MTTTYTRLWTSRNTLFYTTAQLEKIHRQFEHPSASKLLSLLKRAGTQAVDATNIQTLKRHCITMQALPTHHNTPVRFRVSIGHEHVRFNARVYIDIMYLDGKPVLHIVDESTRFFTPLPPQGLHRRRVGLNCPMLFQHLHGTPTPHHGG